MDKKSLIRLGVILLVLTAIICFLGIIKPNFLNNNSDNKNSLKVAVVNEDKGTKYNGEFINISDILLNKFKDKPDYKIELVSRNVAENGIKNNTYQLMIVMPSKFSEESLALESTNPSQAVFQYKISNDRQAVVKNAEKAVKEFKNKFNESLIDIYFTSVIASIHNAQLRVNDVVKNDGEVIKSYNSNLTEPLYSYAGHFNGLSSSPSALKGQYSNLDRAINNTNDAFTSIVNINKTYEGEIKNIKTAQNAWKKSIDENNKRIKNYDLGLSKFNLNKQIKDLKKLNKSIDNEFNKPDALKETSDKAKKLNSDINKLIKKLESLNSDVDSALNNYESEISKAVEESLNAVDGKKLETGEIELTLGMYNKELREHMLSKIDDVIYNGKYYTDDAIDKLGLSEEDTKYLKNTNKFINWYTKKNNKKDVTFSNTNNTIEYVKSAKDSADKNLKEDKVLSFRQLEGNIAKVVLYVPDNYVVKARDYQTVKVDTGAYEVLVPKNRIESLDIHYSLVPVDKEQISLVDPVLVKGEVFTTDNVNVATDDYDETIKKEKKLVPVDASNPDSNKVEVEVETKILKQKNQVKSIERKYTEVQLLRPFTGYMGNEHFQAFYMDVKSYVEAASMAKAFYDFDLHHSFGSIPETALIHEPNADSLKKIIVSLIKKNTLAALKDSLKVSDEEINAFREKLVNVRELRDSIRNLRYNTDTLMSLTKDVLSETEKVSDKLKKKPAFNTTEVRGNTDMVNVTMKMNTDLSNLMRASKTLMDNTKQNQIISKDVYSSMDKLSQDVQNLENEGKSLSGKVSELKAVMDKNHASNEEYLKAFANVLSNTKNGNKRNEAVYAYLSNPVDAQNIEGVLGIENINKMPKDIGLFIVVLAYLVALSTAYLLQHANIALLQSAANKRVHFKNAANPMLFLTSIGVIAGLIISALSLFKIGMSFGGSSVFIIFVLFMILAFIYGLNALIAKMSSLGFIIAVVILLLLFATATTMFGSHGMLSLISPLTYVENGITAYINDGSGWGLVFTALGMAALGFGVLNVYMYRILKQE